MYNYTVISTKGDVYKVEAARYYEDGSFIHFFDWRDDPEIAASFNKMSVLSIVRKERV